MFPAATRRLPVFSQITILSVELAYDIVSWGVAMRAARRRGRARGWGCDRDDYDERGPDRADVVQSGDRGDCEGPPVREIDALGGVMGEVTDAVGFSFACSTPAGGRRIWSPRAQCDKKQYRVRMKEVLEREPNLHIKQAEVAALIIEDGRVRGVHLMDGRKIRCGAIIITTGTFLNGLAHIGEQRFNCGRNGEPPSQMPGRTGAESGVGMDASEDGYYAAASGCSFD